MVAKYKLSPLSLPPIKYLSLIIRSLLYGTVMEKQWVPPLIAMGFVRLGIGGLLIMLFMLHPRCVMFLNAWDLSLRTLVDEILPCEIG